MAATEIHIHLTHFWHRKLCGHFLEWSVPYFFVGRAQQWEEQRGAHLGPSTVTIVTLVPVTVHYEFVSIPMLETEQEILLGSNAII